MDANSSNLLLVKNTEYLHSTQINSNTNTVTIKTTTTKITNDEDEKLLNLNSNLTTIDTNENINQNEDEDDDDQNEPKTDNNNNNNNNSDSESVSDLESDLDSKDDLDSNLDDNQLNDLNNDKNNNIKSQQLSKLEEIQEEEEEEENSKDLEDNIILRNKQNKKRSNELDSVRFSMYNIQNSQINEIDALLSELNQLQTELVVPEQSQPNNLDEAYNKMNNLLNSQTFSGPFINSFTKTTTTTNVHELTPHSDENIEAIDQQFDEVLKFLAQSIEGHNSPDMSSSSPSSMSLSATPNSDSPSSNSENKNDSKSSESSGIISTTEIYVHEITKLKPINNQSTNVLNNNQTKRNSSDSAFVETVSMPSSVSLGVINQTNVHNQNQNGSSSSCSSSAISETSPNQPNKAQQSEAQKAELIRIALEKLKEANIKKLIVKAYTDDGCAKSVIIDETMKIYDVMLMLFTKNHFKPTVNYCIVEYLPKFNMERIFEDHENLVEAMSNWSRDSDNQIFFTEKSDKYDLFLKPELYLTNEINVKKIDESERSKLVEEFFQNIGSPVPEIEGPLYLKVESKKSWKKHYCVLRQSGLYHIPKGKSKKDMQCLFNFDKLDLYYGIDWRKEFKAPTDSCFALKYPQVQKKTSKYIKYICCENPRDMKRWLNGIRIAKFGKQLFDNYKRITDMIEITKMTGRIPLVNNRRLSTTICNSQRPRSSYSLVSNTNSNSNETEQNQNNEPSMKSSFINLDTNSNVNNHSSYSLTSNNNINISLPTSLLIRKDSNHGNKEEHLNKIYNEKEDSSKTNSVNSLHGSLGKSYKPPNYQVKQPNLAYTDQLKTLIHSNQMKNQFSAETPDSATNTAQINNTNNTNTNKSWQNMLSPISVSTNLINNTSQNKSSGSLSNSPNKLVKIPVTTDSTKQLMSCAQKFTTEPKTNESNFDFSYRKEKPLIPQRNYELEAQMNKTNDFTKININSTSFNLNFVNNNDYSNENVYDLPSPPIELLQPQIQLLQHQKSDLKQFNTGISQQMSIINQDSLNHNTQIINNSLGQLNLMVINRNSKGPAPPVAPKPVLKRINSLNENDQLLNPNQFSSDLLRKKSFDSGNGENINRLSNQLRNSNQNPPQISNELSTILARQKKKIEDSENENRSSQTSQINQTKPPSPTITKKPPPPPRNERSNLARKMSNESARLIIN